MVDSREITILLVEDDPGHARLIEKNLRRALITNSVVHLDNGQKLIDYLFSEGDYVNQKPARTLLVLLDLNMPVMDGYQVLERMKGDSRSRHIPVIVLTTTDDLREITRCYELGCNIYVTKPVEYPEFVEAIRKLGLVLSVMAVPDTNS